MLEIWEAYPGNRGCDCGLCGWDYVAFGEINAMYMYREALGKGNWEDGKLYGRMNFIMT
jgi:hypothetical protein